MVADLVADPVVVPSKHSSGFGMVRALGLRSRGGRAGWFGGVISAGWSSAGRWSAGRWSAGVEDLQTERVAGRASCRESEWFWWSYFCRLELCWEMVGGQGEWGPLEGPLVRRVPSTCCLLFL